VDASGEFFGKRLVDHPVPLDAALACEGVGHDADAKVRLAGWVRAGMAGVKAGFVHHLEVLGGKAPHELLFDLRLD
jgi:hypothetical protein